MDTETILTLIAIGGTVSGIMVGWAGRARSIKQDTVSEAAKGATLQADMAYLKRGIDDMRVKMDIHGQRYDALAEMTIRMDESIKSAHKRIDKLEAK